MKRTQLILIAAIFSLPPSLSTAQSTNPSMGSADLTQLARGGERGGEMERERGFDNEFRHGPNQHHNGNFHQYNRHQEYNHHPAYTRHGHGRGYYHGGVYYGNWHNTTVYSGYGYNWSPWVIFTPALFFNPNYCQKNCYWRNGANQCYVRCYRQY